MLLPRGGNDRFVTTGAVVFFLFAVLFLLTACEDTSAGKSGAKNKPETALEHAKKHLNPRYICPMHPRIIKDAPSTCPICGMDLVKQKPSEITPDQPVISLAPDVIQKMGVRTATVEQGKLWKYIKTVGYVGYNQQRLSVVRSPSDGWVENLGVRRQGLQVKRGQLLLELYSPEFLRVQKEFIEAQKKDHSSTLKKYGQRKESVPSRDYLRYLGISESAMNEIARTGKVWHRIPIYAPQFGVLVRHEIRKHMFVETEQPMFVIADTSSVWVEAHVFEQQLEWVKRGLMAEIRVQALPGRSWTGQVSYIEPELDPKTRTLKVRLLIPNPRGDLKPNMFAQAIIYGGPKQNVLKIPRESLIVTGERESVVKALGNGKFQPVDVVTGMTSQGEVEIISGLKQGDRIVVSGQFLIDSEANLQASFQRFGRDGQ